MKILFFLKIFATAFLFGYRGGKNAEEKKNLIDGARDVVKTQKRRHKRSTDSNDDVLQRMRKYLRR